MFACAFPEIEIPHCCLSRVFVLVGPRNASFPSLDLLSPMPSDGHESFLSIPPLSPAPTMYPLIHHTSICTLTRLVSLYSRSILALSLLLSGPLQISSQYTCLFCSFFQVLRPFAFSVSSATIHFFVWDASRLRKFWPSLIRLSDHHFPSLSPSSHSEFLDMQQLPIFGTSHVHIGDCTVLSPFRRRLFCTNGAPCRRGSNSPSFHVLTTVSLCFNSYLPVSLLTRRPSILTLFFGAASLKILIVCPAFLFFSPLSFFMQKVFA